MASQHSRECLVQKLHLYGHLGFKEVRIHGAFEEINSFVKFPSKSERQFVHPWLFTTKPIPLAFSNTWVWSGPPTRYLYLPP